MNITTCVQITYNYSVEVPEEIDGEKIDGEDAMFLADAEDPVYSDLCKVLHRAGVNYSGETISVINDDTGEVIWAE